ncbi:hypothetical protein L207DRAFT_406728, partial [Hyaloscypha variabilis F]
MPLAPQFSLSLELANILPIKSALSYTASTVVNLARELKRSGSDLLVEEDLAAIFGRGKIQPFGERATPDPDYDGILATLQACLSQTSQFSWDMMRELVESKFEKSRSWLELQQSPLKRLSTNTLLAVMDYLYLVQSLPENRLIMIDNQMGVIPIIIWAHCILGLRVL